MDGASPRSSYTYDWLVRRLLSGDHETPEVRRIVSSIQVDTEAEKQQVNAILQRAPDSAAASTRLFFASCAAGNLRLSEFLLPQCDIHAAVEHETVIMRAARYGHLEMVHFLLAHGAKPRRDDSFMKLLRSAVSGSNEQVVELVLQLAGDGVDVRETPDGGRSLLMNAVSNDDVAVAELLLAHGALLPTEDSAARTRFAQSIRSVAMAQMLNTHGADFRGEAGLEAVVEAVYRKNEPLIEFFVSISTVDLRRFQYRTTSPLHCATIYRRFDLITFFAEQCIDLDTRLENGTTALQQCFVGGEEGKRAHQLLVELGADVGARSYTGVDSNYRAAPLWVEPRSSAPLRASERRAHGTWTRRRVQAPA